MTAAESKGLKIGSRVYWQGDREDMGRVTELSWDGVTIAWETGHVAKVHHGDMREVQKTHGKKAQVPVLG